MEWWREARFGMFVHWGLYSGLAGAWMKLHSDAIYGTTASPFENLPWGRCTQRKLADGHYPLLPARIRLASRRKARGSAGQ